jgi:hypothetical protein
MVTDTSYFTVVALTVTLFSGISAVWFGFCGGGFG